MKILKVTKENALFQEIAALSANRSKRRQTSSIFVEGVMSIDRAVASGAEVRNIVYPAGRTLSSWAAGLIERFSASSVVEMSPELFGRLSEKDEPSEIIMIVSMPSPSLGAIVPAAGRPAVVVDRPVSCGNLGTIIRSCDAFGASGVVVTGHAVDLFDPKTIRSSMGSIFSVPSVYAEARQLFEWLDSVRKNVAGLQLVGTSAKADALVGDVDFSLPSVILIGNETAGLSRALKEKSDVLVKIPITGTATSLNVACAATVFLYEARATAIF